MSLNKPVASGPVVDEPSGLAPLPSHRWVGAVVGIMLGLALGFAGARFWLKDQADRHFDQVSLQFEQTLARQKSLLDAAQGRLDALQAQLTVEQSTRKGLEGTLQSTQDELGRVHDQLAFFDQLLPPGPNGSVNVRAFDVEQQGSLLMYRVLLMRNAPDSGEFKGTMQFTARGTQNGKEVQMELKPAEVSASPSAPAMPGSAASGDVASLVEGYGSSLRNQAASVSPLALSFEQFQRSGGALQIPAGFVPKAITLKVLEGSTVRVSRSVNMPAPDQ